MQELKSLKNQRYLLRCRKAQLNLAIIEAKSIPHAEARAIQLSRITNLVNKDAEMEILEVAMPMKLPTFLDAYFDFLDESPISTNH